MDLGPLDLVFLETVVAADLISALEFYVIRGGGASSRLISKFTDDAERMARAGKYTQQMAATTQAYKPSSF